MAKWLTYLTSKILILISPWLPSQYLLIQDLKPTNLNIKSHTLSERTSILLEKVSGKVSYGCKEHIRTNKILLE